MRLLRGLSFALAACGSDDASSADVAVPPVDAGDQTLPAAAIGDVAAESDGVFVCVDGLDKPRGQVTFRNSSPRRIRLVFDGDGAFIETKTASFEPRGTAVVHFMPTRERGLVTFRNEHQVRPLGEVGFTEQLDFRPRRWR